jgi:hypothetical protein
VGRNRGGYHGERIDPDHLLEGLARIALARRWEHDPLRLPGGSLLPAFVRRHPGAHRNIYLSSGIHGDEPAGPVAIRRLVEEDLWPECFNYWVIPCLNPAGFRCNTRENGQGRDVNRDYAALATDEARAHVEWLSRQPSFEVGIVLHEDWESDGFYLYELNPDCRASLAPAMVERVASVCPVDLAERIDGREASGGMIRFTGRIPERVDWPEALYLVHHKTRLSYTLEAPSDFHLPVRVDALVTAVRAALDLLKAGA